MKLRIKNEGDCFEQGRVDAVTLGFVVESIKEDGIQINGKDYHYMWKGIVIEDDDTALEIQVHRD